MKPKHVRRAGIYYRVCGATWIDPSDTAYAKRAGGRWNPPGEFGALYLNRTVEVARANARRFVTRRLGDHMTIEDINAEFLPDVVEFEVASTAFVDAITAQGRLRLPDRDRAGENHGACRAIARTGHAGGESGIAALSSLGAPGFEELAIFDSSSTAIARPGKRHRFGAWYPMAPK